MLPKREKAVTLEDVYEVSVAFKLLHLCFMSSQSAGEGISKTFLLGWGWGMPLDHPRSSPANLIMWAYIFITSWLVTQGIH